MSSPTALKSRILLLIWCQLVLRERLLNGYFSCLMVWVLLRDRLLWKAGYTMLSKLAGVLGEVFSVLKVVGKTWCSSVDDMQLNDGVWSGKRCSLSQWDRTLLLYKPWKWYIMVRFCSNLHFFMRRAKLWSGGGWKSRWWSWALLCPLHFNKWMFLCIAETLPVQYDFY